ncbi:helix-turn-helix domain-containing protein [Nonomuraea wenchangensis]|uniref:helix-turn-helix domain-containing protein n=1 Tax=Nonomuraea wenchangensis TaxID=568860 RepID=UPI0037235C1D
MAERTQKNPLGPTGECLSENISRLRRARGMSYRELSEKLSELGRPIPTLGLSRIENRERRVDADDLMALAVALAVNPNALLLPPVSDKTEVEITAGGSVPTWKAWRWGDGREPLKDPFDEDDFADFQLNARPKGRRRYHVPGERTSDEKAAQRAASAEIAARLYPDDVPKQQAFLEREAKMDPEAWAGD